MGYGIQQLVTDWLGCHNKCRVTCSSEEGKTDCTKGTGIYFEENLETDN